MNYREVFALNDGVPPDMEQAYDGFFHQDNMSDVSHRMSDQLASEAASLILLKEAHQEEDAQEDSESDAEQADQQADQEEEQQPAAQSRHTRFTVPNQIGRMGMPSLDVDRSEFTQIQRGIERADVIKHVALASGHCCVFPEELCNFDPEGPYQLKYAHDIECAATASHKRRSSGSEHTGGQKKNHRSFPERVSHDSVQLNNIIMECMDSDSACDDSALLKADPNLFYEVLRLRLARPNTHGHVNSDGTQL